MTTVKRKKKGLKTAPFDIYIYIACTGEKFLLKNVHAEMKIRELKCYAELVVGIPYNLQRLQYLDEGDMLDDSDLRHNDVVPGATINLKLWRMWDTLVPAVCKGSIDQVLNEGVVVEKGWESLDPLTYRNKVALAKDRASVALFIAAHRGRINLIRSLIDYGEADVNMKTPFGRTPLHAASSQGHSNTIDLMLEKGASMDEIDVQGKSALTIASQWGFKDSERHLFLFQWQTRAAKTKHRRASKSLMMHQQFDSSFPTWLKGKYSQVYFCQTLPPGEFAGTGISAPRRRPVGEANQLRDSFFEQSSSDLLEHQLPPIDGAVEIDGARYSLGGKAVLPHIRSKERLASRYVVMFKSYLTFNVSKLLSRVERYWKQSSIVLPSIQMIQTFVLCVPINIFQGKDTPIQDSGNTFQSCRCPLNGSSNSFVLKCRSSCR